MPLKYEPGFRAMAMAIETHLYSDSYADADSSSSSNGIPIHISQTSFNWRLIRNQRDF